MVEVRLGCEAEEGRGSTAGEAVCTAGEEVCDADEVGGCSIEKERLERKGRLIVYCSDTKLENENEI